MRQLFELIQLLALRILSSIIHINRITEVVTVIRIHIISNSLISTHSLHRKKFNEWAFHQRLKSVKVQWSEK